MDKQDEKQVEQIGECQIRIDVSKNVGLETVGGVGGMTSNSSEKRYSLDL